MNDYIWDKTGPPDPEVTALEEQLRQYRFDPERARPSAPRVGPLGLRPAGAPWWAAAAAAALVTVGLGLALHAPSTDATPYRVEVLEGHAPAPAALCVGDAVTCDEGARTRIHVGDIGSVELEPKSRVRVEPGRHDEDAGYRLFLERGTLRASIFSAPRVFQLGTPSGIAVDLGCVYTTTVDDDGRTTLRVVSGAVSFEAEGRRVHVPSGAECLATPTRGPGTPVWSDQSATMKGAVERLDGPPPIDETDLAFVLAADDPRDTLTWFHLLDHSQPEVRARALDRLLTVVSELDGRVDRDAVLAGDAAALTALRDELDWRW